MTGGFSRHLRRSGTHVQSTLRSSLLGPPSSRAFTYNCYFLCYSCQASLGSVLENLNWFLETLRTVLEK